MTATETSRRDLHQDGRRASASNRRTKKIAATAIALALVGAAGGSATWSAFTATTANQGNDFTAGTVVLTDNDSNGIMFQLAEMAPGESIQRCITVEYTGTLDAAVGFTARQTDPAADTIEDYLDITVEQGGYDANVTKPTTFGADCSGYIATGAVNHGTQTLAQWHAATALSQGTWTQNRWHVYRITAQIKDTNLAQGTSAADVSFTWNASNV